MKTWQASYHGIVLKDDNVLKDEGTTLTPPWEEKSLDLLLSTLKKTLNEVYNIITYQATNARALCHQTLIP